MSCSRALVRLALPLLLLGCDPGPDADRFEEQRGKSEPGKADASAEAVFLQFTFSGELLTSSSWNVKGQIEDQLLYTIGHLNGERSVGRLDRLVLDNIKKHSADGRTRVTYRATLPVAWNRREAVPTSYTLRLPRDVSYQAVQDFTAKYKDSCVDWSAHDVDSGSMWYYYRPDAYSCKLAPEDIIVTEAAVEPSGTQTTGKFPEYHKVWEDDVLQVVAVFGKYEDGATASSDAGISAYNTFVRRVKTELKPHGLQTTPAEVPYSPGVDLPDIEFHATFADGRRVQVVALLVDNVRTAGTTFRNRYEQLSSRADLIAYNGHAGLGANIRALAQRGKWIKGQYVVVFMNGCDTYAYVDSALADTHAAVNSDDPQGTKYVDIITNAMPSYFSQTANSTMALLRGLMRYDEPRTFEQMFASIDSSQVVLVSGEEDNVYVPGGGGEPTPWEGLQESGTVARNQEVRYETPTLAAGEYVFRLTGTADADLYVRIGAAPTTGLFDCRPYRYGSKETCVVELPSAAPVHVMVRGWAASSKFQLAGSPQD